MLMMLNLSEIGLANSEEYVACAPSEGLLRIFTVTGLQYHLVSMPGQFVCMAAQKHLLAVVYHHSLPINGTSFFFALSDLKE